MRAKSLSNDRGVGQLRHLPVVYPDGIERPVTRGDCAGGARPCPFVSCQHHLYLDVSDVGSIKTNFPGLEVDQMAHSCVLDVADQGGAALDGVGDFMNVTRERIRQIEKRALGLLKLRGKTLAEFADEGDRTHVRARPVAGVSAAPSAPEFTDPANDGPRVAPFIEPGGDEAWNDRVYRSYIQSSRDHGFASEVKTHENVKQILEEATTMARQMTERNTKVIEYYTAHEAKHGSPPSTRAVAEALGLEQDAPTLAGVRNVITRLRKKGAPKTAEARPKAARTAIVHRDLKPAKASTLVVNTKPAKPGKRGASPIVVSLLEERRRFERSITAIDNAIEALSGVGA